VALLGAVVLACAWSPAAALGDGDPASDVLLTQPLFLPSDAGATAGEQAQLASLLQVAQRSGYQVRLALIASPADLGSVTALWRRPQSYAEFLGQELALAYHGSLLVVMPDGFGLYGSGRSPSAVHAALAALAGLPAPSSGGPALASSALLAVPRLAAASGFRLVASAGVGERAPTGADPVPWVVLGIGGLLIAVAWTASLRARPLQLRGRSSRAGATG